MKIPYEVKEKLHQILQKRQCCNKPYPDGSGLQYADFNETTSEMVEYLKEFLKEELIKYESHRRLERLTNPKEFEFAEQAVDNYLNQPIYKPTWEAWSANVYCLLLTYFGYTSQKAEDILYGRWTDCTYDMWKEGYTFPDAIKTITNPEQTWNENKI